MNTILLLIILVILIYITYQLFVKRFTQTFVIETHQKNLLELSNRSREELANFSEKLKLKFQRDIDLLAEQIKKMNLELIEQTKQRNEFLEEYENLTILLKKKNSMINQRDKKIDKLKEEIAK